jgi:hypothetical protein
MNRESYAWVFEISDIYDNKIRKKLFKLAKELGLSEWKMLIDLCTLPDVIIKLVIFSFTAKSKKYFFFLKAQNA